MLYLFLGSVGWVLLYRWINPPVTYLMIKRAIENDFPVEKQWVELEEISPYLPLAAIAAEDQHFLYHHGFDWEAIKKAARSNKKKKKRIRGGSTISQQTAKNVFLFPARNLFRKALEAYFTVLIELLWSKQRIMEVYLNVVEMGKGVYGVEAASQKYFRTSAKKVSREQAAALIVCLPNPLVYNPVKPTKYVRKRKQWVLRQMRYMGGVVYLKKNKWPVN